MNSVASFFVEIEVEGTAFCSWGHVGPRSRLFCRCVALGVLDFVGHTHIWHWQCVTCRAMPKGAMDSSSSERCLPACLRRRLRFGLACSSSFRSCRSRPSVRGRGSQAQADTSSQPTSSSLLCRACVPPPLLQSSPSILSLPSTLSLSLSGSRWNRNRNRNGAAVVCRLPLRPLFDTPPHPTPVLAS
jgi:hypothetical protein